MNRQIKEAILHKIQEYDSIAIFRHIRNDGDCIGASKGLKEIIRATWPEKRVILVDRDIPAYLEFMGPEDEEVADSVYASSLGIVVDTASKDRISNPKYALCRELVKIDHHIPVDPYGNLAWVEQQRSSCSEMIVDFCETFRDQLVLNTRAATYLYTGMVTDSGRFRYTGVTGETMRLAGKLLDVGVDTERLFAQLYLESYETLKRRAGILERVQMTANGVAYLYIDRAMQSEFGLSLEQAGACVDDLSGIRGSISWLVLLETGDENGSIRARLRSRFVHINSVAEKYHGGGHACACGATVYSREEMEKLLLDLDETVKAYKEAHDQWL